MLEKNKRISNRGTWNWLRKKNFKDYIILIKIYSITKQLIMSYKIYILLWTNSLNSGFSS